MCQNNGRGSVIHTPVCHREPLFCVWREVEIPSQYTRVIIGIELEKSTKSPHDSLHLRFLCFFSLFLLSLLLFLPSQSPSLPLCAIHRLGSRFGPCKSPPQFPCSGAVICITSAKLRCPFFKVATPRSVGSIDPTLINPHLQPSTAKPTLA